MAYARYSSHASKYIIKVGSNSVQHTYNLRPLWALECLNNMLPMLASLLATYLHFSQVFSLSGPLQKTIRQSSHIFLMGPLQPCSRSTTLIRSQQSLIDTSMPCLSFGRSSAIFHIVYPWFGFAARCRFVGAIAYRAGCEYRALLWSLTLKVLSIQSLRNIVWCKRLVTR